MKYKRILTGALALALTLPLLIPWVQAHPGRTDANGGHTDTDTGDYHYHHGYEAHAHFDIDGNGTIDCPFDFVNKTGQNSGTRSTGTSTPGDGSEDGYQEGYEDGYKRGEKDGQSAGYIDGAADSKADYDKQLLSQQEEYEHHLSSLDEALSLVWKFCGTLALTLLVCIFWLRSSYKQKKAVERKLTSRIAEIVADNARRIDSLEAEHEAKIDRLTEKLNTFCESSRSGAAADIQQLKTDHAAEIARIRAAHDQDVRYLKAQLRKQKRFSILDKIASGEDEIVQLPPLVRLKLSFTPIKGNSTDEYPYGFYTVFLSTLGNRYHCKRDCAPSARPMHFFDLPSGALPCSKCVGPNMHPQPLPEWYHQVRKRLDEECAEESASANQPPSMQV